MTCYQLLTSRFSSVKNFLKNRLQKNKKGVALFIVLAAMATLSILDTLCKEHGLNGIAATRASIPPLIGFQGASAWANGVEHQAAVTDDTTRFNDAVIHYIQTHHVRNVLLSAVWGDYHGADAAALRPFLLDTLRQLKEAGARVWILRDVPRPQWDVPRALAYSVLFPQPGSGKLVIPPTYYDHDRLLQDQLFQGISSSDVTLLDPTDLFLNSNHELIVEAEGRSLYFDGGHLSTYGAARLRPLFEPMLNSLAPNPEPDPGPEKK